jgi:rSAM/selenodomain-associated transferase 1
MASHESFDFRVALAVMARAPSDDRGKTRLLSALGVPDGADLRRAILLDTLEIVDQVTGVEPIVIFTPATAEAELAELTGDRWGLTPQRGEGLGERLENAFADLLARGHAGVLIMGSDLPTLPPEYLQRARSELLNRDDPVVLGPARDGGYYLIGLRKPHPELFRGVAWSASSVLAATVAIAESAGLPVTLVAEWDDIDTVEDLRRIAAPRRPEAHGARHTEQFLERLDGARREWPGAEKG